MACHAGQLPIFYGHPNGSAWHQGESIGFPTYVDLSHTPRYPFGYFGVSDIAYNQPKALPYPTENLWG